MGGGGVTEKETVEAHEAWAFVAADEDCCGYAAQLLSTQRVDSSQHLLQRHVMHQSHTLAQDYQRLAFCSVAFLHHTTSTSRQSLASRYRASTPRSLCINTSGTI